MKNIVKAPRQLSERLHRRLLEYTTASKAGPIVGTAIFAVSPLSPAIIVDKNPIHIPPTESSVTVPFDIHGTEEFHFFNWLFADKSELAQLWLYAQPGNGFLPGPLSLNAKIGPGGAFATFSTMAKFSTCPSTFCSPPISHPSGPWANKTGYLGFEFTVNGAEHFGWAKITVTDIGAGKLGGVISEFAYNPVPNQPILAGQTSAAAPADPSRSEPAKGELEFGTLGLLALGAVGLRFSRRRRRGFESLI